MCNSHLTASWAYLASLQQFVEIARAIGNTQDYVFYSNLSKSWFDEFNWAFFDGPQSVYDTGLQSAQVLPMSIGIVPPTELVYVADNLLNDIYNHSVHLTTGISGTKYLFLILTELGRNDVALQLAENVDYPSFGYMAVNNIEPATTFWELWDTPFEGPGMNSRNHIMFGSISDWFYKALAGIMSNDAYGAGGYTNVNIEPPNVVSGLLAVNATFLTQNGNITSNWERSGGSATCGQAADNHVLTLDCGSVGSSGVISDIAFASYGTPGGYCTQYHATQACALNITDIVKQACVGKTSCSFNASVATFGQDPCQGTFKRVYVQAVCSQASRPQFSLQTSIPVGSVGNVHFPRLDVSNWAISESGNIIWQNGKFIPNAAVGVTSGVQTAQAITFQIGSGAYSFSGQGTPGQLACAYADEKASAVISCPSGQTITCISFASFGVPSGSCGSYAQSATCHVGYSKAFVERLCLGQNSCSVLATTDNFGEDPCYGTVKHLAIQAVCAM
eukprot:TRINITY_DN1497_c0_g1_i4.p1 TRINITY_DN1497_c0_g1~~TRINITY_DN1497_c0_g1_i4.p1  ORF type:complete len:540 (-),score=92.16 TRINITY_DN1497_c0_g1_i4:122-1633(-)